MMCPGPLPSSHAISTLVGFCRGRGASVRVRSPGENAVRGVYGQFVLPQHVVQRGLVAARQATSGGQALSEVRSPTIPVRQDEVPEPRCRQGRLCRPAAPI